MSVVALPGTRVPPISLFALFRSEHADPSRILSQLAAQWTQPNPSKVCEALLFFRKLVVEYPVPAVVNSALLKLADLFLASNNFVRFYAYRVLRQCVHALPELRNVDQLVKRIGAVLTSNDPLARAITLRVLGCLAAIVRDRVDVHHHVRGALHSSEAVEVDAALYAMRELCKVSPLFAHAALADVAPMLRRLETPPPTKRTLIALLQHMTHSDDMCAQARALLRECAHDLPAAPLLVTALHSLTALECAARTEAHEHARLLLGHAVREERPRVVAAALRCLARVVRSNGHMVDVDVRRVLARAPAAGSRALRVAALRVVWEQSRVAPGRVEHIDVQGLFHPDARVHVLTLQTIANVLSSPVLSDALAPQRATLAHTALDCVWPRVLVHVGGRNTTRDAAVDAQHAAELSASVLQLCRVCDPPLVGRAVASLVALLGHEHMAADVTPWARCLAGMATLQPLLVRVHRDALVVWMGSGGGGGEETQEVPVDAAMWVLVALMRAHAGSRDDQSELVAMCSEPLRALAARANPWQRYRIALRTCGHGFHTLALPFLEQITSVVEMEHHYYWLLGLLSMVRSDAAMGAGDMVGAINQAEVALTNVRAARNALTTCAFQERFIHLHIVYQRALLHLQMEASREPALPHAAQRLDAEHAHTLQRDLLAPWHSVLAEAETLSQWRFDMDHHTLAVLASYERAATTVMACVGVVLGDGDGDASAPADTTATATAITTASVEDAAMGALCARMRAVAAQHTLGRHARLTALVPALQRMPLHLPRMFACHRPRPAVRVLSLPAPAWPNRFIEVRAHVMLALSLTCKAPSLPPTCPRALQLIHMDIVVLGADKTTRTHTPPALDVRVNREGVAHASVGLTFTRAGDHHVRVTPSMIDESGVAWTCDGETEIHVIVAE